MPKASASLALHETAAEHCADEGTPRADFLARKCPARWRFALFLAAERAWALALRQDFAGASAGFAKT